MDCADSYSVVGAIDRSVLSESIDGTVITDSSPFECTLKDTRQQVLFTFNESATDPSNSCKYTLAYKNDVTGATFSGTQALSCSNATLDFSTTAAADDPTNCPDVPPDDPKILLKMKNCGTED